MADDKITAEETEAQRQALEDREAQRLTILAAHRQRLALQNNEDLSAEQIAAELAKGEGLAVEHVPSDEETAARDKQARKALQTENRLLKQRLADLESSGPQPPIEERTPNQLAARLFRDVFSGPSSPLGVYVAPPCRVENVDGRRVLDGWMVAFHDDTDEMGCTVIFHGQGRMKAYISYEGHKDRAHDIGKRFGEFFARPPRAKE